MHKLVKAKFLTVIQILKKIIITSVLDLKEEAEA